MTFCVSLPSHTLSLGPVFVSRKVGRNGPWSFICLENKTKQKTVFREKKKAEQWVAHWRKAERSCVPKLPHGLELERAGQGNVHPKIWDTKAEKECLQGKRKIFQKPRWFLMLLSQFPERLCIWIEGSFLSSRMKSSTPHHLPRHYLPMHHLPRHHLPSHHLPSHHLPRHHLQRHHLFSLTSLGIPSLGIIPLGSTP